ncbi:hypothetical protein [Leuconostoc suionicum]|nr:hypothetical protein [Leuconostoc suionicum]
MADLREIISRRTELLMMSVGYDPNRIADGEFDNYGPSVEHYHD